MDRAEHGRGADVGGGGTVVPGVENVRLRMLLKALADLDTDWLKVVKLQNACGITAALAHRLLVVLETYFDCLPRQGGQT